ncbi:acetate--CoA ligase family protein [Candidatus Micrarchaeota archaeon]|nr:acetate--CoA ligase family protein [Candidatus Micrarchaeota archaeon]
MTIIDDYRLLERYGFKLIPYGLAKSIDDAKKLANKIGYPVVMKIISPQASHKTEIGGVRVNIKNEGMLELTYKEFEEVASSHKLRLDGILIQKMARKGIELIVGAKRDEQFGHLIILGLGGIYVEIFKDISARLCPINESDIDEMIDELKSHPVITGARGKKAININELKRIMLNVCKFVSKEDIKEMDLNPIVFDEKGGDIIDVRFTK